MDFSLIDLTVISMSILLFKSDSSSLKTFPRGNGKTAGETGSPISTLPLHTVTPPTGEASATCSMISTSGSYIFNNFIVTISKMRPKKPGSPALLMIQGRRPARRCSFPKNSRSLRPSDGSLSSRVRENPQSGQLNTYQLPIQFPIRGLGRGLP